MKNQDDQRFIICQEGNENLLIGTLKDKQFNGKDFQWLVMYPLAYKLCNFAVKKDKVIGSRTITEKAFDGEEYQEKFEAPDKFSCTNYEFQITQG